MTEVIISKLVMIDVVLPSFVYDSERSICATTWSIKW